jgi:hypothetical protein
MTEPAANLLAYPHSWRWDARMKIIDPYDEAFFERLGKRFPGLKSWQQTAIKHRRWKRWGTPWAESHGVFFRWV